nr:hypothetical protein CFP56_17581 [Quercus suber]
MQKVENLILQSKTTIVDAVTRKVSSGFKLIGLVLGVMIRIDSHKSGRQLEEKVTNVHEIVTVLLGNVTKVHEIVTVLSGNVINMHSSIGENFHNKLCYFIFNTLDARPAMDITTRASLTFFFSSSNSTRYSP